MSSRRRHGNSKRSLGIDGPSGLDDIAERSTQFNGEKTATFENPGRLILERAVNEDEMLMSLMGAGTLISFIDQLFIALNNGKFTSEDIGIHRERIANIANSAGALQFLGIGISLLKKYGQEANNWFKTYRVPARSKTRQPMCIQTFESPNVKWKELGTPDNLPNFEVGKESGDAVMHFTVPLRDGDMKVGIVLDGITNTKHIKTDVLSRKDLSKIIEEELSWFQTKNKNNINRETIGYFLIKIHEKLVAKGIAQGFFERATAGMFFHLENRLFMVRAADTKWNVTTYDEKIDDIITLSPPPNHIEHFDDLQIGSSQTAMLPGISEALLGVLAQTAEENVQLLVNTGEKYNREDKQITVAAFGHSGPIEKFVDIDEIQIDPDQPLFVQISSDGLTELSRVLEVKQPWMLGLAFSLNSYASRIDPNQGRGKNSAKIEGKVSGNRVLRPETFLARQLLARPFVMAHLASLYLMIMGKVPKDMDYRFKKDDTCLLFYRSESLSIKVQQALFKHISAHSVTRGKIIHDYESVLNGGWKRFTTLFSLLTGTVFPEGKSHYLKDEGEPTVLDLQSKAMKLIRETLMGL